MKTNNSLKPVRKSTYAMLVQSEEKERGLFETFVYGLLILSAVVGIWQFAHLRVPTPLANTDQNVTTQVAAAIFAACPQLTVQSAARESAQRRQPPCHFPSGQSSESRRSALLRDSVASRIRDSGNALRPPAHPSARACARAKPRQHRPARDPVERERAGTAPGSASGQPLAASQVRHRNSRARL